MANEQNYLNQYWWRYHVIQIWSLSGLCHTGYKRVSLVFISAWIYLATSPYTFTVSFLYKMDDFFFQMKLWRAFFSNMICIVLFIFHWKLQRFERWGFNIKQVTNTYLGNKTDTKNMPHFIYVYMSLQDSLNVNRGMLINKLRPRQMAAIFQMTFSNAFSLMKIDELQLRLH